MTGSNDSITGRRYPGLAKRTGDFVVSSLALLAALPLILALGILVKLTSRGPVFDSQVRLGQFGQHFRLWKLRTRRVDGAACCRDCLRRDPRLTVVGQVLKVFHLDALPALWNVVQGDMSLVGPKPDRPELLPMLEMAIKDFPQRMLARPGLTGLAQVCLPPGSGLPGTRRRVEYDLFYLRHIGFGLDLRLIIGQALLLLGLDRPAIRTALALPTEEQVRGRAPAVVRPEPAATPEPFPEPAFSEPAQLSA